MGFHISVAGVSLRDRVRSSEKVLCVERSQLRWFECLVKTAGKRPWERPRNRWRDYISKLARERLGIPQTELVDVAWKGKIWVPCLNLCPRDPTPHKQLKMRDERRLFLQESISSIL